MWGLSGRAGTVWAECGLSETVLCAGCLVCGQVVLSYDKIESQIGAAVRRIMARVVCGWLCMHAGVGGL